MSQIDNFFPDIFDNENFEEEEFVIIDKCVCSECQGCFILPPDLNIDKCPICGANFN